MIDHNLKEYEEWKKSFGSKGPFSFFEYLDKDELFILEKYIYDNYSYQDIANELNISKSTVYRKYNNIIKKLKDEFTN